MNLARLVAGIIVVLLHGVAVFAAAPIWRWSNPTPHGAHIFGLASRGSTVVQVGEFGQVFFSDDLEEWRPWRTGLTNTLRSAVWFGSRVVIVGSEGTVLHGEALNSLVKKDLGTDDWMEGVAASDTRVVAVGDNGGTWTSTNGIDWQRLANAPEWMRSVAYGGGSFVAVGDAGFVTRSPDGLTWTPQLRQGSKDLNRVVWLNDRFWMLGNEGTVRTSTDGIAWTPLNLGTTNDLFCAASDGVEVVVVGRSVLLTSAPPFLVWTSQTGENPAPPSWTYYSAIWDGAEFLVGGRSGMFVEGFKPAGSLAAQWFSDAEAPRNWLWSMTRVGGIYAASGDHGGIFTSSDGFRFSQEATPSSAQDEILEGIGGSTNLLLAVGTAGVTLWSPAGTTNIVSTNSSGGTYTNEVNLLGIVWNEVSPRPTTNELQGVGVFGSTYIITGGKGTILTSTDGRQWTPRVSGVSQMLSSVAASPTRVVVTGDFGTVLTSDDAISWTVRTPPVTNWIYQVRYLNNQFVAVGEAGLILTGPDGVSWTRQNSGATKWLNSVAFESGSYFAVGTQGTMLRSSNAVDWVTLPMKTSKSLYDLAGEGGQLLVAGMEGAILRARLAPWTTPVNFVRSGTEDNAHVLLFSGELDERFTLQRSMDFNRWFDVIDLEVPNNTGAFIHYDALLNGLGWFFRTRLLDP